MDRAQIGLTVNGELADLTFAPNKTLLEVLREDLGLTRHRHRRSLTLIAEITGVRSRARVPGVHE